jgi:hypothetical protein
MYGGILDRRVQAGKILWLVLEDMLWSDVGWIAGGWNR